MSSVPSPRVRKPKPRARLNHLTMTISKPPTVLACARVRAGGGGAAHSRLRFGDRDHPEHLKAALAPLRLGDDPRAFANGREPVAPQHRDMDENVGLAAVRHDEAVALGGVEPFDAAGDFDQPDRALVGLLGAAPSRPRLDEFLAQFGPHSTRRLHILAALEPLARREWDHPLGSARPAEIRNASDSRHQDSKSPGAEYSEITRNLSVLWIGGKKNPPRQRPTGSCDGRAPRRQA